MTITKPQQHRGDALSVNSSTRTERQWLLTDHRFIGIRCIEVNIDQIAFGNDDLPALALEGNISSGTPVQMSNHWLQAQRLVEHLESFLFSSGQVACAQFWALEKKPCRNTDKLARRDHACCSIGDALS
jgi:hypothetical protein